MLLSCNNSLFNILGLIKIIIFKYLMDMIEFDCSYSSPTNCVNIITSEKNYQLNLQLDAVANNTLYRDLL